MLTDFAGFGEPTASQELPVENLRDVARHVARGATGMYHKVETPVIHPMSLRFRKEFLTIFTKTWQERLQGFAKCQFAIVVQQFEGGGEMWTFVSSQRPVLGRWKGKESAKARGPSDCLCCGPCMELHISGRCLNISWGHEHILGPSWTIFDFCWP